MADWTYNEHKHCGVDYSDKKQAENYDTQHRHFRDYEKEFIAMMEFLSMGDTHDSMMIDLGCGTGATLIYASKTFKKVYGVDVSDIMIEQAKVKAEKENITNIEFINSGFISYSHAGEPADLVVTKAALHHLPDFWKQAALMNVNRMLKPGGSLYIFDVVFNFNPSEYKKEIDRWISDFEAKAGGSMRAELETHIRDEYSTYSWIIEGMLERSGFKIQNSRAADGFLTEYHCIKISN